MSNSVIFKRRDVTRIIRVVALICAAMGLILLVSAPQEGLHAAPNDAGTKTVIIPVEGMTCVSCVARVKRTLRAIDGVVAVKVDLEQRSARVRYLEERVPTSRLVDAINRIGYKAGTPTEEGIK